MRLLVLLFGGLEASSEEFLSYEFRTGLRSSKGHDDASILPRCARQDIAPRQNIELLAKCSSS